MSSIPGHITNGAAGPGLAAAEHPAASTQAVIAGPAAYPIRGLRLTQLRFAPALVDTAAPRRWGCYLCEAAFHLRNLPHRDGGCLVSPATAAGNAAGRERPTSGGSRGPRTSRSLSYCRRLAPENEPRHAGECLLWASTALSGWLCATTARIYRDPSMTPDDVSVVWIAEATGHVSGCHDGGPATGIAGRPITVGRSLP